MPRCPTCQDEVADGVASCPRDGTRLASSLDGTVLGERYRIVRLLGEGGMGRVYLAEHVLLGKQVAVKVLRPDLSAKDDLVKRFQLEAVAASQIGQENIVDVTDFGQTPDRSFYYVMELVPGRSLAQHIDESGPMPAARALPILAQICKALRAAHARGIVHRDLKPDNVIITRLPDGTERAKVLDFGISKVGEGPKNSRITQAGMVVGTPHYMAPEQALHSDVDLRADIYAFGVLAYEVATGHVPFEGENPMHVLLQHQSAVPDAPSTRAPEMGIPEALEQLILSCLQKRAEDRPQTVAEVLAAVDGCMIDLGLTLGSGPLSAAVAGRTDPAGRPLPSARPPNASRERLAPTHISNQALTPAPRPPSEVIDPAQFADRRGIGVLLLLAVGVVGAGLLMAWAHMGSPSKWVRPEATAKLEQPEAPASPPVSAARPTVAPPPLVPPVPRSPAPKLAQVVVASIPEGAQVLGPDRTLLGRTPLSLQLAQDERRALRLEVAGYRPEARTVGARDGRVEVKLQRLPSAHAPVAPAHQAASPQPTVSSPADDGYRKVDRDDIRDPYGR